MQFITNGPDIPDGLLQAHEDGRLIFFCGAGVSYPAGLPGFAGLVKEIYKLLKTRFEPLEKIAYDKHQYDTVLALLERRIEGDSLGASPRYLEVRQKLLQALKPKLNRSGALETHSSLLRLGKCRGNGDIRLVTTNFDRLFEIAGKRTKQSFESYSAPMLPIPKNSKWNGLVYLHGKLPKKPDGTALKRLVVTSGDFGLAYLVERWAARFVSELFRNYEVCFVGYSIDDPVLRYMMDALAADRMYGESMPQAWAFGSCKSGQSNKQTKEWKSKGVTPILYQVDDESKDHSLLHRTLKEWSELFRDGVNGKEQIVVKYANANPDSSRKEDDFAGRLLWAISDKSGLPAKRFSEINPVPWLEWLTVVFGARIFNNQDLSRFSVCPLDELNEKYRFTLTHRPARYDSTPSIRFAHGGQFDAEYDPIMTHLTKWFVRHLHDSRLVLWVASQGGQLHERLAVSIETELNLVHDLEQRGNISDLDYYHNEIHKIIPNRVIRKLWRMIVCGRLKRPERNLDLYLWKEKFDRDGLTCSVRQQLYELLMPKIAVYSARKYNSDPDKRTAPTCLSDILDWNLVLHAEESSSILDEFSKSSKSWNEALPKLLPEFQRLLVDALELLQELGEVNDLNDRSFWDLPSISPHAQNVGIHEWVALIELLRDSWVELRDMNIQQSNRIAESWYAIPFATFKRLAFFAASKNDCISHDQWVSWLIQNDAYWLWSNETRREVLRLLVLQGNSLGAMDLSLLEQAILIGPRFQNYRQDIEPDRLHYLCANSIWIRLAKLKSSGIDLSPVAQGRLDQLSLEYPQWKVAADESDEFLIWRSSDNELESTGVLKTENIPWKRTEIVRFFEVRFPGNHVPLPNNWRDVCRRHLLNSLYALNDLGDKNIWHSSLWSDAFNVWSENQRRAWWSWRFGAKFVNNIPFNVLVESVRPFSLWLEAVSKSIDRDPELFLNLCLGVLKTSLSSDSGINLNGKSNTQPVSEAINHPVGDVTQALLNLWFLRKPLDNDGLPSDLKPILTMLCDVQIDRFRHARVILASRLVALYRVDKKWTQEYLLPIFFWNNDPSEAKRVWDGFLWSLFLYPPLMVAMKPQFLDTVSHYEDIGERKEQYVALLTHVALGPLEGFTYDELNRVFDILPIQGLEASARALVQAIGASGDKSHEFWKHRVAPFLDHLWPKSKSNITPNIVQSLSRLVILSGSSFPQALMAMRRFLRPIEDAHHVVIELNNSKFKPCDTYPRESLNLLSIVIADNYRPISYLRECLDKIKNAAPHILNDTMFKRLDELCRRSNL